MIENLEKMDELKTAMREAGYTFFSISRENNLLVFRVKETLYGSKAVRFWEVLEDLDIPFGTCSTTHADLSTFGQLPDEQLPEGEYDLTQ